MKIQYLHNSKGKSTGVFIPINEWEHLKKQYKDLKNLEIDDEPSKNQILAEINESFQELKLVIEA